MRAVFVLFFLSLFPLQVEAAFGALAGAFQAYVKVRELEEELALLPERFDLEGPSRETTAIQLAQELTNARKQFRAALGASPTTPWEKTQLERLGAQRPLPPAKKPDPEALAFLASAFPNPRNLRPLEWQAVADCFGHPTQEAFLHPVFAMEEAGKGAALSLPKGTLLLWVSNPYERFLSKSEATRRQRQTQAALEQLRRQGYAVENLEVSPFPRLDDQAEELHHALRMRLEKGKVLLLSAEEGSAIVHRALDLNPELLQREEILGWMNVNGKLFGTAPELSARRKPASVAAKTPLLPEQAAKREMLLLHREGLHAVMPLGAHFPVVNLVSAAGSERASENLRESLVSEGRTFYVPKGSALEGLAASLPVAMEKK